MKGYAFKELNICEWVNRSIPEIGPFDALIKPTAVSVCTSDVHNVYAGKIVKGTILGHEGIGRIVETGDQVRDFKPGDMVIIPAVTPIWRSMEAQMGIPQHAGGFCYASNLGIIEDGLFSEYTKIHDADMNLAHMPKDLDIKSAVMIGDMVNTGLYGAELADIQIGDVTVVFGIGPVGLMSSCGALLRGSSYVVAVEAREKCIEIGKKLGIAGFVDFREGDTVKKIRQIIGKKNADNAIVTFAAEKALNDAMAITKYGGTVSNIGSWVETKSFSFDAKAWGYGLGQKTIRQGLCPGGRARMERLIELVMHKRLDPGILITHSFKGLDAIPDAFNLMAKKPSDLVKTIIYLD